MASNHPALPASLDRDELFGHPKGLYVCFFTEMWERFSFYGMKALLALYLIKHHGFTDAESLSVLGAYGGLVYATPVLGGILADRYLGMRKAVLLGGVLLCLGHLGMAVEGHAATVGPDGAVHRDLFALSVFYLSLALIISGVGFLKPNISTVVGKLYAEGDPRLDSGFTLFYAGINVGALFSALICGYLGERYGWSYGFGAAGIGMLAGLAVFLTGQKYLQGHAEPPDPEALRRRLFGPLTVEWAIYLCAALALPALWALMQLGNAVLWLQVATMAAWLGWLAWYVTARCNKVQRQHMLACVFFVAVCLLFFTLYEQTYGSWVTFTDRLLTKDIMPSMVIREGKQWPWSTVSLVMAPASFMFTAWLSDRYPKSNLPKWLFISAFVLMMVFLARDMVSLPQNASSLTYLSGPFILALAPIFSVLWGWLDRRGLNPSKPAKSAIGLMFAGLSFIPLALAAKQAGATGEQASVWWLVLTYGVMEVGEMCLSPVGLSAVTQLSVPRVVSLMMGTWFLATAFSETLAAAFGKLAALDKELPAGGVLVAHSAAWVSAASKYEQLFWKLMCVGVVFSVLAFIASPLIRRGMHGVK